MRVAKLGIAIKPRIDACTEQGDLDVIVNVSVKRGDGEMTFDEIGAVLGITGKHAAVIYRNAIKKLRNRPHVLAKMRALALELARNRKPAPENCDELD